MHTEEPTEKLTSEAPLVIETLDNNSQKIDSEKTKTAENNNDSQSSCKESKSELKTTNEPVLSGQTTSYRASPHREHDRAKMPKKPEIFSVPPIHILHWMKFTALFSENYFIIRHSSVYKTRDTLSHVHVVIKYCKISKF